MDVHNGQLRLSIAVESYLADRHWAYYERMAPDECDAAATTLELPVVARPSRLVRVAVAVMLALPAMLVVAFGFALISR